MKNNLFPSFKKYHFKLNIEHLYLYLLLKKHYIKVLKSLRRGDAHLFPYFSWCHRKILHTTLRFIYGWQKFGFGSIRVRINRTSDKNFIPKPFSDYKSDILIRPGPEPGCPMSGPGCPNVRIYDVNFEHYNRNFVWPNPNPIVRSCIYKFF